MYLHLHAAGEQVCCGLADRLRAWLKTWSAERLRRTISLKSFWIYVSACLSTASFRASTSRCCKQHTKWTASATAAALVSAASSICHIAQARTVGAQAKTSCTKSVGDTTNISKRQYLRCRCCRQACTKQSEAASGAAKSWILSRQSCAHGSSRTLVCKHTSKCCSIEAQGRWAKANEPAAIGQTRTRKFTHRSPCLRLLVNDAR